MTPGMSGEGFGSEWKLSGKGFETEEQHRPPAQEEAVS